MPILSLLSYLHSFLFPFASLLCFVINLSFFFGLCLILSLLSYEYFFHHLLTYFFYFWLYCNQITFFLTCIYSGRHSIESEFSLQGCPDHIHAITLGSCNCVTPILFCSHRAAPLFCSRALSGEMRVGQVVPFTSTTRISPAGRGF